MIEKYYTVVGISKYEEILNLFYCASLDLLKGLLNNF